MSLNYDKPILREFAAAGKLVNEWRDTISYTALGAFAVADFIQHKQFNNDYLFIAYQREFFRNIAWSYSRTPQIAGYGQRKPTDRLLGLSALAAALSIAALRDLNGLFINQVPLGFWGYVELVIAPATVLLAGGPKKIYQNYADIMWDYPRKRGGGGTTQTRKLKDGFKSLGTTLGGFLPQPAGGMARKNLLRVSIP